MQDSKDNNWASDYNVPTDADSQESDVRAPSSETRPTEADGWKQYRRWISKAPAPRGRRTGVDLSLYSWKGYRNWSEQVKRDWTDS
jgi:hypothetical protein